ncbi:adenylosuccinate lyase [Candidatus Vecturithrix granuli]|uniref:Adenylosuccinate lyase n=1 Tax=Vecturithrix granuli TaxID=1499967 RepID=A0A081C130_VECG1|nr:adenylosuccinate lyase [Candidatus Vecturithrix granuli]
MEHAISPLDGRYAERLSHLSDYFSEFALMRSRCRIELLYVLALDSTRLFAPLTSDERERIAASLDLFSEQDYDKIKAIEATTRHDVKACEMFLRKKVNLADNNLIHFGLTSEDVNNLAYNLLFKEYLAQEQLPQLGKLLNTLCDLAEQWKAIPFPARTHGQKASPTTAGKEVAVFLNRLHRQYRKLKAFRFTGKLNGAVGNFSAMLAAFPEYDWMTFSANFVQSLGLVHNIATTQIEDHDTWAEYFNITRQINNIVLDLDQDFWQYIAFELFYECTVAGEVGSSTMPHKVNPINFENSEGNLLISNSLLALFADKLCRSRMQRDLSDSTVTRNIGVALAHAYLALTETLRGLQKVTINREKCLADLNESPELLAEPVQTILRTAGVEDPYMLLKEHTRGKKITREALTDLVNSLAIDDDLKQRMGKLEVSAYIGDAARICDNVVTLVKSAMSPEK